MNDRDAMLCLVMTEFVVRIDENRDNSGQCFKTAAKTTYPTSQYRKVVPKIGIYSLDRKCVVLVLNIAYMLTWINYVHIAQISVGTILQRRRRRINNPLNSFRRLVIRDREAYDLARFTAHHRNQVDIFMGFPFALLSNEPIKLI